jgi:hypothetical protein
VRKQEVWKILFTTFKLLQNLKLNQLTHDRRKRTATSVYTHLQLLSVLESSLSSVFLIASREEDPWRPYDHVSDSCGWTAPRRIRYDEWSVVRTGICSQDSRSEHLNSLENPNISGPSVSSSLAKYTQRLFTIADQQRMLTWWSQTWPSRDNTHIYIYMHIFEK